MKIDSYRFGRMQIGSNVYTNDLIIYPDRIHKNWIRRSGHLLGKEDITEILELKPDLLIIGTGKFGMMKVPLQLRQMLQIEGITTIAEPTSEAVWQYNCENTKNKVAMFHLTC